MRVKSVRKVSSGYLATPRFMVASMIHVESPFTSSMATWTVIREVSEPDVEEAMATDMEPSPRS